MPIPYSSNRESHHHINATKLRHSQESKRAAVAARAAEKEREKATAGQKRTRIENEDEREDEQNVTMKERHTTLHK